MTATNAKLGKNQEITLRALAKYHHGAWYPGAGWECTNESTTVRLLESLVRRGLVDRVSGDPVSRMGLRYQITEAGRDRL